MGIAILMTERCKKLGQNERVIHRTRVGGIHGYEHGDLLPFDKQMEIHHHNYH
jgi:hypothetical protein